ncbi:MAG: ABC transporter permease [Armatimonadota bacterium]|nr:ABC transporter permease [Armatimonadota bacterium]
MGADGTALQVTKLELVIEGGPRPRLGQALRELWAFRHTVLAFAERDVRVKYKQTVLGVLWAILQPLAFMVIFSVAFGRLAKVPGGGAPYAAFSLSVLVPWTFLQTAVTFGANSLLMDSAIIRKVYLPREVPVLGAVAHAGVDLAIGVGLFALLAPVVGARFSPTWLLVPILAVLLGLLAVAVALPLAALNVYYRDFRYALPFALQLWLFASPVAYPLSVVPAPWRELYVTLNPAAGLLDAFRRVLAMGAWPDPGLLAVSLAGTAVLLWAGYWIFKGLEPNFADVV